MKLPRLLLSVAALGVLGTTAALAQGTAFTYQGRLDDGGAPATGTYDLSFTVFNAATGGTTAGTRALNNVGVTNGLFTVTLDFGAGVFTGAAEWLEIGVRPGTSTGAYTGLAPRQAITPMPYAIYAGGANATGLTGTLPATALSGTYSGAVNFSNKGNTFAGNAAGLTNLSATNLVGTVADARVSANVALRSGGNAFSGAQTITNGNVGIGTSAPVDLLSLNGGALSFANPANPVPYVGLDYSAVSDGLRVRANVAGTSLNTTLMTILRGGNVGIGTTNPLFPLQVNGSIVAQSTGATKGYITLQPGNPGTAGYLEIFGTNSVRRGYLGYNSGVSLVLENSSSFNITGGNIGIGTTTPNFPLSFPNSSGEKISLYGQDTNTLHGIGIGGSRMEFYVPTSGHNFAFGVGSNAKFQEAMHISGNGNVVASGEVTCTAVNITSDRNAKEKFKSVNAREVLAKVVGLPITEWQYKSAGDARHIGPMAQDFHAAFALGHDEKHITSVDEDGVALAAIQGLHQMVQEKDAELGRLKNENQSLAERLAAIERVLGLAQEATAAK